MILFSRKDRDPMPKLIKNAKENIMQTAKQLLTEEGLAGLNMRTLASTVGVAAGTLYNYFPSKEHLVAAVMLEDWENALRKMESEIPSATTASEGLEIVFDEIRAFADTYRTAWDSFHGPQNYRALRQKYHKELIDKLSDQIRPLGVRFGFLFDPTVAPFISEILLTGAAHAQGNFRYLLPCLKRIVGEQ